jgi:hypothetical protein
MLGPSAGRAQAALFTVSLDYAGGAGCPDVEELEGLVSTRLGYDPFVDGAPDRVSVHIAPRGGALEGRIEWHDSTGRWAGDQSLAVASNDCRHLSRALAAALAVQIQLLAQTTGSSAGTASPTSTGSPPETPTPQPVARSPSAPITPPEPLAMPRGTKLPAHGAAGGPGPVFAMGAGSSVGVGMSSSPVLLGRVLGSLAWQHLSVELDAEVSVPTTTRRADGAGFSQQHLLAGAAACAMPTRWRACLVAKAGEVRMAGEDIDRPTSAVVPVVEAGARLGIVQVLGRRFFVAAHADGLANVIRWRATLDQVPVWTAPRFSAVIGIDAVVRLP